MIKINKNIKKHLNAEKYLLILFYASIFLVPANLFVVWRTPESYLSGHFIDYLAPKLYLNQIVVWCLWLLTLVTVKNATRGKGSQRQGFRLTRKEIPSWVFWVAAFGSIFLWQTWRWQDIALLSLLLNWISGPLLLLTWILKHREVLRVHLWKAVLLSSSFQAGIGIIQWIRQKSIIGYWFLGEPNLSAPGIATSSWSGEILRLPYATTPHPNILAGWLLLGIISSIYLWKSGFLSRKLTVLFLLMQGIALFLSESWSAWITLLLLGILYTLRNRASFFLFRPKSRVQPLLLFLSYLLLQILWFVTPLALSSQAKLLSSMGIEALSITRRSELQTTGWKLAKEHPFGSGFRLIFQGIYENETSYIGGRFLQPPHNAPFFIVIIGGIWIILLLLIFFYLEHNVYSIYIPFILLLFPIFTLDHYAITTICGQYIFILLTLFLKNTLDNNKSYNNL